MKKGAKDKEAKHRERSKEWSQRELMAKMAELYSNQKLGEGKQSSGAREV